MAAYNSLQAGYRYVTHKGLTLTLAYTWQHSLANQIGYQSPYLDFAHPRLIYGQPGQGQHQFFNGSYIWHTPFPEGPARLHWEGARGLDVLGNHHLRERRPEQRLYE